MRSYIRFSLALAVALTAGACSKDAASADGEPAPLAKAEANPEAEAATATATAMPSAEAEAEHVESCEGAGAAKAEGEASCGMPGSGCNQWDEAAMEVTRREVPADAVWKTWEVDGMTCGGCERRVMAHVGKLDGVVAVKANAGTGRVSVAVAPGAEPNLEAARGAIAGLGYTVGGEQPTL